ncbi:uncharacterized protein LOC121054731 [Oryza brachyantha]|uniref:uncharacterized protein LOC121054731 n=1 Tax=Oryza brachyantha TaxID=4533 RepID=UPI001ADB6736|nr:uncharacterized protein LOC121054731 [Oryza brachyantha]
MQNLLEILDADAAAERRLERLSVVVRTVMKCSHLEKLVTLANKFGVNDLHIELHNPTIAGKARMRFKDAEPFGQLAEISFHSVTIASDTFRKAIARCPSLRALDLRRCRLLDVIAILPGVATNLRCHKLERVDVVSFPSHLSVTMTMARLVSTPRRTTAHARSNRRAFPVAHMARCHASAGRRGPAHSPEEPAHSSPPPERERHRVRVTVELPERADKERRRRKAVSSPAGAPGGRTRALPWPPAGRTSAPARRVAHGREEEDSAAVRGRRRSGEAGSAGSGRSGWLGFTGRCAREGVLREEEEERLGSVSNFPRVKDSVGVSSLRSVFYSGHFLSSFYLPRTIDALFTDLYICYYGSIVSQVFDKWSQKALPKLSNLSNLTICNNSLQIVSSLCKAGQTSKLAWLGSFQHLTELQLLVLEMTASNLANIFAFLQHVPCPNLRKFFLQLPRIRDSDQQASLGLVNEEMPEDGLDNLRVVRIMNFNLTSIDTQFVSFLLGKARNISKLQLVCPNNNKRPLGVLGPDPIFDLKSSESGDLSTRPCHSEVLFDF